MEDLKKPNAIDLKRECKRLHWAGCLTDKSLEMILQQSSVTELGPNNHLIELYSEVTHLHLIVRGSADLYMTDRIGKQISQAVVGPGSIIGLLSLASRDSSHLRVTAREPMTVLSLPLPVALTLMRQHEDIQWALLQQASHVLQSVTSMDRNMHRPSVVGIVHLSPKTEVISHRIAGRLKQLEERLVISSNDRSAEIHGLPFQPLGEGGGSIESNRDSLESGRSKSHRLLVDLRVTTLTAELLDLLSHAEVVLWCLRPADSERTLELLSDIERQSPWVKPKIRLVWLLDANEPHPPWIPQLAELVMRDFKVSTTEPAPHQGKQLGAGIERIVHFLRGVQVGLALGGGAARGMAHLGVFQTLEKSGIVVDRIAGTSAGAMTGTVYASGMSAGYSTECFKNDLLPNFLFRHLPAGGYWYLLYKYRFGLFEGMLRKYLKDLHMEQLMVPMTTVAVDLVAGEPVVRTSGDATQNVLESINLPPLALPIYSDGKAVVDGGLLNNVPADVLVDQGCNFVIASSVTAKLEKDFMKISQRGAPKLGRLTSTLQVMMRQGMIQSHSMNGVGVAPADFVIAPDVTAFDISQFTRADELARIGYDEASEHVSKLRKHLKNLDPQLF